MKIPGPADDDIIVKVKSTSLCGSDLHLIRDKLIEHQIFDSRKENLIKVILKP